VTPDPNLPIFNVAIVLAAARRHPRAGVRRL